MKHRLSSETNKYVQVVPYKKSPSSYGIKEALPYSQKSTDSPYRELDESNQFIPNPIPSASV